MGLGHNFGSLTDGFITFEPPLGINKVRRKDGIDESGFSEASLTYLKRISLGLAVAEEEKKKLTDNDDIKLETALKQFVLNLAGNGVETDVRSGADFFCHFF